MYLPDGALNTHKQDQVKKVCGPLKRGLQVRTVVASWYVSEGHLDDSAGNWWRLLEKVAIIVRVDLLC